MGYRIKVDTNGTEPRALKQLLEEKLLDYVALDFKGIGEKHREITLSNTFDTFANSLTLLQQSDVTFEVRTTWHANLLSLENLNAMVTYLERQGYKGEYFIQYFKNGVKTLSPLPSASNNLDPLQLSTAKIKVTLRTSNAS